MCVCGGGGGDVYKKRGGGRKMFYKYHDLIQPSFVSQAKDRTGGEDHSLAENDEAGTLRRDSGTTPNHSHRTGGMEA